MMMKENETLKMIDGLTKNLEGLIEFQKQAINQIPNEHINLKIKATNDIESLMESVRNGEMEKIIEIQKRYASSDNK
jgi:hypothetical protein